MHHSYSSEALGVFAEFLETCHSLPKTSSAQQLDRLTRAFPTVSNDVDLKSEKDLAKREVLLKDYQEELDKSLAQSR